MNREAILKYLKSGYTPAGNKIHPTIELEKMGIPRSILKKPKLKPKKK